MEDNNRRGQSSSQRIHPAFSSSSYHLRRRVMTLVGSRIDITNSRGEPCLHCHQKAFKLREDIRLYSDDTRTEELLAIIARNIIDFSAAYDVWDRTQGIYVGTLRRKGWTSLMRDLWEFCDEDNVMHAQLQEDNAFRAFLRRAGTNLIPQSFQVVTSDGQVAAILRQHFNPFVYKLDVEIHGQPQPPVDTRLILAAAALVAALEGRQR